MIRAASALVRAAPPDSDDANPEYEAIAAFELVDMYDKGENKRRDGTSAITEDQITQLKTDYGRGSDAWAVVVSRVGKVNCPAADTLGTDTWMWPSNYSVLLWNANSFEPPTERMFD